MARYATKHGAYEIDSLPSQVQVGICHGFFVRPDYRGQGHGTQLKRQQNAQLCTLGYDYGICTVAADNLHQKQILSKTGWRRLTDFFSQRQDQIIEIWGYAP